MKLIHSADSLLDTVFDCAVLPLEYGKRRRECMRGTFRSLFLRAAEWPADAVLLAGGVFDNRYITRDTVGFLRETFEMVRPVPVFITPGPMDPFNGSTPWTTEAWPANVYIFDCASWTSFELQQTPLTVHGFSWEQRSVPEDNPFGTLDVPDDGRIHIALAHGMEASEAENAHAADLVFDAAESLPPRLRYMALGGFPEMKAISVKDGPPVWYPGSPESHGFDEPGLRQYLEIELDADSIEVFPKPTGSGCYSVCEINCESFSSVQAIAAAIREQLESGAAEQIVRVHLRGVCHPAMRDALPSLRDRLSGDTAFLILEDETLAAEDYENPATEKTGLGVFLQRINSELKDAPETYRKRVLERARETGVAAYRGREVPVPGMEERTR